MLTPDSNHEATWQAIANQRSAEADAWRARAEAAEAELVAIKARTCATCRHRLVWTYYNQPGCYKHRIPLPPDCFGCAAHERKEAGE